MDGSTLSSNWKQLQATLKAGGSAAVSNISTHQPHLRKRKRDDSVRRPDHTAAATKKARRDEESSPNHKRRPTKTKTTMNVNTATATNGIKTTTTTTTKPSDPQPTSATTIGSLTNAGLTPQLTVGKYLALDCEMVGTGPTTPPTAQISVLARVSVVTYHGAQLYDSYVLPLPSQLPITDYRTAVSGITPACIKVARPFALVQAQIAELLKGRVLVGHSVQNDLKVLGLSHPRRDIRDTARYGKYRDEVAGGGWPRLRDLAARYLGLGEAEFQAGAHSSVEDARVTMMLFRREKEGIEREVARRYGRGVAAAATAVDASVRSPPAAKAATDIDVDAAEQTQYIEVGEQGGSDGDTDSHVGDGEGIGILQQQSTAPPKKKKRSSHKKKKKKRK